MAETQTATDAVEALETRHYPFPRTCPIGDIQRTGKTECRWKKSLAYVPYPRDERSPEHCLLAQLRAGQYD